MPKFVVQFALPTGKMGKEVLEANTERAALAQMEGSGRTPISVQLATSDGAKRGAATSTRFRKTKGGKGTRRAVLDFTHQLAAVAESGIPIVAGLRAVGEQTGNPQLKAAVSRMVGRIEGGRTLADAIDAEPETFPELYAKTLAAGESAGQVPEVLNALARYMEQEQETRSQIRSAMMYPILVVMSLVLATVVLLIFVVPQFKELFKQFESELPVPTQILLAVSGALTDHYILVAAGVAAFAFAMRHVLSFRKVREFLDYRILR
ncbi:MAG TPA: type II secretion system F family protein, partial [Phycisphaerae bacterium]|nr:type II secretion system F family protein [Phycisphaerae bacterium]